MIGEKYQGASLGFVPDFDATQKQIVVPRPERTCTRRCWTRATARS